MDKDYVCGDYGVETQWTQIRVTVKLRELDELTAIMSMVSNNLQIEDYSDIDLKTCYGDLIDESILNADKTIASVSVYLPAERRGKALYFSLLLSTFLSRVLILTFSVGLIAIHLLSIAYSKN